MAKFKVFGVFVVLMLLGALTKNIQASLNNSIEITEDENNKQIISLTPSTVQVSQGLSTDQNFAENNKPSGIKNLPQELIIHIASYLGGKDFHCFTQISKNINSTILQHKAFFPDTESLLRKIQTTKIKNINKIRFIIGRIPTPVIINQLNELLPFFESHHCDIKEENIPQLPLLWKNFKSYIITKNLLWDYTQEHINELNQMYRENNKKACECVCKIEVTKNNNLSPFAHFYEMKLTYLTESNFNITLENYKRHHINHVNHINLSGSEYIKKYTSLIQKINYLRLLKDDT